MSSFGNGDKVEVKTLGVWFPATVIRSAQAARRNGKLYVSYDTLFDETVEENSSFSLRAFADPADVRPARPPEGLREFRVGEEVEVLTGRVARGWRKGCVRGILGDSRYVVAVAGCEVAGDETRQVENWSLRASRVWDDGSWVPPFLHEEQFPQPPSKSSSIHLKIKRSHQLLQGTNVEVMRQSEGGEGEVWYPATIIKPLPHERFLVGYLTLRTEECSQYVKEEVGILHIRPSPPIIFLAMPVGFEQVDGWYSGGWWAGYVSRAIGGSKYLVCLRNTGEEMVFDHYKLRPHQDLDEEGGWNLAPKISSNQAERSKPMKLKIKGPEKTFTVGMMVEIRTDEDGYIGSLYPAKIVNSTGNGEYLVQYQTLRTGDRTQHLEEVVAGTRIRPCPPKSEKDDYQVLEEVDAWHNEGWWAGLISRFIGASNYAVYFWTTNEEFQYSHDQLRPHQDWSRGTWATAPISKKLSVRLPKREFSVGMMAEVKSHACGFVGAWYSVKLVSYIERDRYIVEYETLRTDDDSDFLQEAVDGYQIRPRPAPVRKRGPYSLLEAVDAWHNDGWWIGLIIRVLGRKEYLVYFWTSNDEMEVHHRDLRVHQDWTDGNWTAPLKMSNSLMASKLGKAIVPASGARFCNTANVEVCSREEGFHDAWYPATIIRPVGDGKYLVQYRTVVRDDGKQLLIQEADTSCIRPAPPVFLQNDPFKALECVDAWYCGGWWVGHIQKVTADSNYLVRVNNTSEVVEFEYAYLRPHQDWLNLEWKSYTQGRTLMGDAQA